MCECTNKQLLESLDWLIREGYSVICILVRSASILNHHLLSEPLSQLVPWLTYFIVFMYYQLLKAKDSMLNDIEMHSSPPPPDAGIQMRTLPSGGWSKDQLWLPLWYDRRWFVPSVSLVLKKLIAAPSSLCFFCCCWGFFPDQFCPVHWNNHHPGSEAAVAWYRRERIKHLPVSYSHQVHLCQVFASLESALCVKNVVH